MFLYFHIKMVLNLNADGDKKIYIFYIHSTMLAEYIIFSRVNKLSDVASLVFLNSRQGHIISPYVARHRT